MVSLERQTARWNLDMWYVLSPFFLFNNKVLEQHAVGVMIIKDAGLTDPMDY